MFGFVVQTSLPGLVDQKEITAALRQCNYDSDEVISSYLTMFGEILLHATSAGNHNYTDLNSFRSVNGSRWRCLSRAMTQQQSQQQLIPSSMFDLSPFLLCPNQRSHK